MVEDEVKGVGEGVLLVAVMGSTTAALAASAVGTAESKAALKSAAWVDRSASSAAESRESVSVG
jgi:hypothetical protein